MTQFEDKIIMPLVSIVIPAYNHELYIEECLNSVLNQNYKNYEIVIIDDGSSDKSDPIINAWFVKNKDAVPHYIYKARENRGVTATLNELVSLSSGDFIFTLASDDRVTPSGIHDLVDYFIKNCNEGSVLYSGVSTIDEESEYLTAYNEQLKIKYELINRSSLHLLTIMFCKWGEPFHYPFFTKSGFLKICGAYPSQYNVEDYYIALRFFIFGDIRFTSQYSREYRIQKDDAERPKQRNYREVMRKITSDAIMVSHGWKRLVLALTNGFFSEGLVIRVLSKVVRHILLKTILFYCNLFNVRCDN